MTIQLEEISQKVWLKEDRFKRYPKRTKQYKQNFQNNERKFYEQVGGESITENEQLDAKETKHFWSKIRKEKEHKRKPK